MPFNVWIYTCTYIVYLYVNTCCINYMLMYVCNTCALHVHVHCIHVHVPVCIHTVEDKNVSFFPVERL